MIKYSDKLYKKVRNTGAAGIVIGILTITAGMTLGILSIVFGSITLGASRKLID